MREARKQSESKKIEKDFRDQMKEGSLQKGKKKPGKVVEAGLEPTWEISSDEEDSDSDAGSM